MHASRFARGAQGALARPVTARSLRALTDELCAHPTWTLDSAASHLAGLVTASASEQGGCPGILGTFSGALTL